MIDQRRSDDTHEAESRNRKYGRRLAITRALLALGLAGTFLLDGIAGFRAATVLGNVMAVALGLTLLLRNRG